MSETDCSQQAYAEERYDHDLCKAEAENARLRDELTARTRRLEKAEALLRWAESMTAVASEAYLRMVENFLRGSVPVSVPRESELELLARVEAGDYRDARCFPCYCDASPGSLLACARDRAGVKP